MSVNSFIPEPCSPGAWVDREICVCGERYDRFRPGITFDQGTRIVREHNGDDGGYRSRGPVLWAMRTMKLTEWFYRHSCCGEDHG